MSKNPDYDAVSVVNDFYADPAQLAEVARDYPELRPHVAVHPNSYAGLLEWLESLNDPAVNAALAQRRGSAAAPTSLARAPRRPRSGAIVLGLSILGVAVIGATVAAVVVGTAESYGPLGKDWAIDAVDYVSGDPSYHESTAAHRQELFPDQGQIMSRLDDACGLITTAASPSAGFTSDDVFASDTFMVEFGYPYYEHDSGYEESIGARLRLFHTESDARDYRKDFERQLDRCTEFSQGDNTSYFSNVQEVDIDGADSAFMWDVVAEARFDDGLLRHGDWIHGVVFRGNSVVFFSVGGGYAEGEAPGTTLDDLDLSSDYLDRGRAAIIDAMEAYGEA
jgi:hypothetical protein